MSYEHDRLLDEVGRADTALREICAKVLPCPDPEYVNPLFDAIDEFVRLRIEVFAQEVREGYIQL